MSDTKELLTPKDYKMALESQDACNSSGVVRSFGEVMPRIWNDVRHNMGGTEEVNRHPIVVLYLTQLVFLAGGESVDWPDDMYHAAYAYCEVFAKEN